MGSSYYYYYCSKCGWHDILNRGRCPFCDNKLEKYDTILKDFCDITEEERKELERPLIELIEKCPDFDPKLRDKRLEKYKRDHEQMMKSLYSNKVEVTCPYCHSKNTRKIGAGARMVSANLFGLGSSNLGKQWHCKNCGSDF